MTGVERLSLSGDSDVRALLDAAAAAASPPGAVAVSGLVAAVAAAVGEAGAPALAASFRRLTDRALRVADQDTEHYWASPPAPEATTAGPRAVARAAAAVAALAGSTRTGNRADLEAARLLAIGAAAAAEGVAALNAKGRAGTEPSSRTGRVLLAAGSVGAPPMLRAERAAQCHVFDEQGRDWFDATSGMWNVPLGHGHPEPVIGLLRQSAQLAAVNPFQAGTAIADSVADTLLRLLDRPDAFVFFGSSGSEVVEAALRFGLAALPAGAPVWSLPSAFHGSTAGAAGLSDLPPVWGPLPAAARLPRAAPAHAWSAPGLAFVEPVRAADRCLPLTPRTVRAVRRFQRAGGLVVVDEIAAGLGRAAWPTAGSALGLRADITLLGKGLGNGAAPVSAMVVARHVAEKATASGPLDFGHTHSNHPASLGAAAACLRVLGSLDLPARTAALDGVLGRAGIGTTGTGFLRAVHGPVRSRTEVMTALRGARLLCHVPSMVTAVGQLVLAPPLTATDAQLDDLVDRVRRVAGALRW
ncbi:aminotransferase class III-fold pyridoxal phosphate-dependent enzyme [Streptomyces sp. NPDC002018]|uniref:aminotransferase class III-fold pyridoxal phosphate-dependent enzyme n=1 Tax=Streptomyces sp. NPDC002018 TaxID=3364629 RepID=UPI0036CB5B0A